MAEPLASTSRSRSKLMVVIKMVKNKRITTIWNTLWTKYLAEMMIMVAVIAWCLIAVQNVPHTPEFFQRLQIAAYAIGLIIGVDIALTMAMTREEVTK